MKLFSEITMSGKETKRAHKAVGFGVGVDSFFPKRLCDTKKRNPEGARVAAGEEEFQTIESFEKVAYETMAGLAHLEKAVVQWKDEVARIQTILADNNDCIPMALRVSYNEETELVSKYLEQISYAVRAINKRGSIEGSVATMELAKSSWIQVRQAEHDHRQAQNDHV